MCGKDPVSAFHLGVHLHHTPAGFQVLWAERLAGCNVKLAHDDRGSSLVGRSQPIHPEGAFRVNNTSGRETMTKELANIRIHLVE